MLVSFIIGMLVVCSVLLLGAWVSDVIRAMLAPTSAAQSAEEPKGGRRRGSSRTAIPYLIRGPRRGQSHEPAILDLAVQSLHGAIRRVAARILSAPGTLDARQLGRVERLMRIAAALKGAGGEMPQVHYHGVPPVAGLPAEPETLSVNLSDLLAARASDHLGAALEGDPHAIRGVEQEAERLVETEDIQFPA
jgi:hypothetical protein